MIKKTEKNQNSLKIPKIILVIVQFLEFISTRLTTLFAVKLFTTPIKHKTPNREVLMDKNSVQQLINVPEISKQIVVYSYGSGTRKALLVHGWSGRGTQLFKIAEELIKNDFTVTSFDAPAHGKSLGKNTIMVEFIASILEIQKVYGTFDIAIGHSLGGMALLNAVNTGLKIDKLITIGAGNKVINIFENFVKTLQMNPKQAVLLKNFFEKKYNRTLEELSSETNAKNIKTPVLVIHDQNDDEVGVACAIAINNVLENGNLLITNNLGHRKILGDATVIQKIIEFIV